MPDDKPEQAAASQPSPRAKQPVSPADRAAQLQAELDKVRVQVSGEPVVKLKVEPPHVEMSYGGVTVGDTPTDIPERHLAALSQAAADAGVTLTQVQEG